MNFTPIPQDPGTFMGDLNKGSFRSLTTYNGKLYVLHGSVQGNGKIIESANPSDGNDAWRQVSPDDPELRGFEMEVFNGQLYVGAMDVLNAYSCADRRDRRAAIYLHSGGNRWRVSG